MSSRIVIGDVHGCFDTLMALIAQFPKNTPITFVGDLIDRGPKSKEVIQYVLDNNLTCVTGNHEQLMLSNYAEDLRKLKDHCYNPYGDYGSAWAYNGGFTVLKSYMIDPEKFTIDNFDMDKFLTHIEWVKKLPLYLEFTDVTDSNGRYLVVSHSAVGNVWKYRNDSTKQVLFKETTTWGRNSFKDVPEIYNIFGHTVQEKEPKIKSFYANIDTGAVYKKYKENGILSAIQFPEMIVYTQKNIDED